MEPDTNQAPDRILGLAKYGGTVAALVLLAAGFFVVRADMGRGVLALFLFIPLMALIGPQLMTAAFLGMSESIGAVFLLTVAYYPVLLLPMGLRWTFGIDRGTAIRWQALLVFLHLALSAGSLVWVASSMTM